MNITISADSSMCKQMMSTKANCYPKEPRKNWNSSQERKKPQHTIMGAHTAYHFLIVFALTLHVMSKITGWLIIASRFNSSPSCMTDHKSILWQFSIQLLQTIKLVYCWKNSQIQIKLVHLEKTLIIKTNQTFMVFLLCAVKLEIYRLN